MYAACLQGTIYKVHPVIYSTILLLSFSLSGPDIPFSIVFWNVVSLFFSITVRDQLSYPNKTAGKEVLYVMICAFYVASGKTRILNLLVAGVNSLENIILVVTVIPKCWNFATFSNNLLVFHISLFCLASLLLNTSVYFCVCLFSMFESGAASLTWHRVRKLNLYTSCINLCVQHHAGTWWSMPREGAGCSSAD